MASLLAAFASPFQLTRWLAWFAAMSGPEARATDHAPAPASDDDTQAMACVAGGDPDALQPIFDRWKLPLIGYFYRALGSRADAEDLTLQTFTRVYRAAPRYRPAAKFSTWLFSIARRELLHELRRRRRKPVEPVAPEDLDLAGADLAGLERSRAAELEEHLLAALQQLPERQRSAVLLVAGGDLSHDEIARTLGVSLNNFNVILHRARQALRALFHP